MVGPRVTGSPYLCEIVVSANLCQKFHIHGWTDFSLNLVEGCPTIGNLCLVLSQTGQWSGVKVLIKLKVIFCFNSKGKL